MTQTVGYPAGNGLLSGTSQSQRLAPLGENKLPDPSATTLTPAQVASVSSNFGTFAWAARPTATAQGQRFTCSDIGANGYTDFIADAALAWRPLNGRVLIAQRVGSLATPLQSITLAAATAQFTLPQVPTLPAGLIPPQSSLWVKFRFRRGTSVGSVNVAIRVGTAGNSTDQPIEFVTAAATANLDINPYTSADFSAVTTAFSTWNWGPPNGTTNGAAVDKTGNINTAASMSISADLSGGTVGDVINLTAYSVWLEA